MKIIVSALVATTLVAGMAISASAAPSERDRAKVNGYGKGYGYNSDVNGKGRPCVVTGWTDWSLTRPIFKCPGEPGYPGNGSRR